MTSSPITPTPSHDDLSRSNVADVLNSPELHIQHAVGLDVCDSDLEAAIKATMPSEAVGPTPGASSSRYNAVNPRWESLDVDIWKGSLDVFNEAFVNAQCMVSMEVLVLFLFSMVDASLRCIYHHTFDLNRFK